MQTRITVEEMQAAARQLARSEHGRMTMQRLLTWIENDGAQIDLLDQRAFLALLGGAWTGQGDKVRALLRETLGQGAATPPQA